MIIATSIGQMVFVLQKQIRGYRFVAMGVIGVNGEVCHVTDQHERIVATRIRSGRRYKARQKLARAARELRDRVDELGDAVSR
jgi:DNA-directed RNA polymerase subunit L